MKLKVYPMLLAAILLVGGCAGLKLEMRTTGDFCDVARPLPYSSNAVADYMAEHDPRHMERDSAQNIYGERNCEWKF